MLKYMSLLGYCILAINVVSLACFAVDKLLAVKKLRRIPEAVLLLLCALWGSLGGLLGMVLFRHKSNGRRHPAFVIGVPVLLVIQLVVSFFLVYKYG